MTRFPSKSHIFSEAYGRATMRPHGYLVADLYPTTSDSCRLRTDIFSAKNNQIGPNDIVPTISPIIDSFKKKNYKESAELQAMHNSKKQMDTLMARHDLPSEIKVQEIGKAQDPYLLFRKRLKSNQSFKSKSIFEPKRGFSPESLISAADNIEPHDMPLDVGQSSESSPGILDLELSETEDLLWNKLPYKEEEAKPTLPPMLPAASVIDTPQNVPWTNYPTPSLSDRTPSYGAFRFQRTDYDLQPRHNRFISFADSDFEMGQDGASRKV